MDYTDQMEPLKQMKYSISRDAMSIGKCRPILGKATDTRLTRLYFLWLDTNLDLESPALDQSILQGSASSGSWILVEGEASRSRIKV